MKVSAQEVTTLLDLIHAKWRVGPTHLKEYMGYSRQTIHTWKKEGVPEKQYEKLEKFLKEGPLHDGAHPSLGDQFLITLSLRIDVGNPTDETKVKVAKTISLLESLRKSWA